MLRSNRGQIAMLIEILAVVAILGILAYVVLPRYAGQSASREKGGVQTPTERAYGVQCQSNLRNIRQTITTCQQTNGRFPASLAELQSSGISGAITKCPVSQNPYTYDPVQGKVSCTTPGHENY